ncbi:efflux RND transporter periplasmic adaptor subunit [Beijerinckia indica]|nr:efflux RND transporter periplasmic adaptor subunit [Beijerinckia indica]
MTIQQEASIDGLERRVLRDPALPRSEGASKTSRRTSALLAVLVLGGGALAYVYYKSQSSAPALAAPPAPTVTVSHPLQKTLAPTTGFLGQLSAIDFVEIRAQVSGYLTEYHFKDGQNVHKGDLLFVIDPRPYQIQYEQAKASYRTAVAQLDLANQEIWRAQELKRREYATTQTVDQRNQQQRGAQAAVDQAQAAVHAAELNLEFTRITAPFDGKISSRRVSVGSLINGGAGGGATGGTNLLTTLVSLDPIYLDFDMSENDYRAYQHAAKAQGSDTLAPTIDVILDDEEGTIYKGQLTFLDNAVERSSGTLRARATIPNPDLALTPGQFARLRVPIGTPKPMLLVPAAALGADQSREIVMTVADDKSVVPKVVKTGPLVDGLRVINEGLAPNDQVIINGLIRARPGSKVTAVPGTIEAAAKL